MLLSSIQFQMDFKYWMTKNFYQVKGESRCVVVPPYFQECEAANTVCYT